MEEAEAAQTSLGLLAPTLWLVLTTIQSCCSLACLLVQNPVLSEAGNIYLLHRVTHRCTHPSPPPAMLTSLYANSYTSVHLFSCTFAVIHTQAWTHTCTHHTDTHLNRLCPHARFCKHNQSWMHASCSCNMCSPPICAPPLCRHIHTRSCHPHTPNTDARDVQNTHAPFANIHSHIHRHRTHSVVSAHTDSYRICSIPTVWKEGKKSQIQARERERERKERMTDCNPP